MVLDNKFVSLFKNSLDKYDENIPPNSIVFLSVNYGICPEKCTEGEDYRQK